MIRIVRRALVSTVVVMLALSALVIEAQAQGFKGKIITSDKRIPTSASSKKAYDAQLRKQSRKEFWEDKAKKEWTVYYAAFFKAPLNDLEVQIKIYDITDKSGKRMLAAFDQWLDGRGQKEIISHIKLDREKFGVNRLLLMTVENRGKVLAQGEFKIRGQAEKYDGKVKFTEEEAASGAP